MLDRLGVSLIGASLEAMPCAEDRSGFKETMVKAGLDVPRAGMRSRSRRRSRWASSWGSR